jgi:hypothetical protein
VTLTINKEKGKEKGIKIPKGSTKNTKEDYLRGGHHIKTRVVQE